MQEKQEIAIIDEENIQDKIYVVRGVKVMLDFELAEIYGYETKNFNRQVKNNIEKFEGDEFMFKLKREEYNEILRCKNFTSSWGGKRYLPIAFTEQGVYMLMTVLRGELATRQSRALVMAFKTMKDFIVETQGLVTQRDMLQLSIQTTENSNDIKNMQSILSDQQKLISDQQRILLDHDEKLVDAFERINERVKQSDISPVLLQFNNTEDNGEYLLREGHPAKADVTYMDIYSKADKCIYIIDNYINIKTLYLLQNIKLGVEVTIFSDNNSKHLHVNDVVDFRTEFPDISISFITAGGIIHDRFIILDYEESDERIYHCGASAKDAAVRLTTAITEITSDDMRNHMHELVNQMKKNPNLV
ncbi:MAG: ORF6N domain-containing protein [Eubacterium sp.]|nr:ORF6N domain-containing protein [Eubacterium sp.]